MKGLIFPVCAALGWIAAGHRARALVRTRDPALLSLCVCFALTGVVFTVSTPAVSAGMDRLTGVANVAAFCIHLSVVTLSFAVQIQVLAWSYPGDLARRKIRRRLVILGFVSVAMGVLFFLTRSPVRREHYLLTEAADRDSEHLFLVYICFYLAALAVGYGTCTWMCWRCAKVTHRRWLRRGLRVTALGLSLAIGYCATRAATFLGPYVGLDPTTWEFLVPLFAGTSTLISLTGLMLPTWGPRLDAATDWKDRYRDYRRLEPLWRAYVHAMPGIALESTKGRWYPSAWRDLDHRLLRRMVELWDGRVAITAFIDQADADEATRAAHRRGLSGEDLAAAIEAAQVRAGLAAFIAGRPAARPSSVPTPAASSTDHAGLADERRWLVAVAEAFTSSWSSPEPPEAPAASIPTSARGH